jgi:hypothetical protein
MSERSNEILSVYSRRMLNLVQLKMRAVLNHNKVFEC